MKSSFTGFPIEFSNEYFQNQLFKDFSSKYQILQKIGKVCY